MKMSSRYHKVLIYDVKWTTKIDGMGPFNVKLSSPKENLLLQNYSTEILDIAHK